MKRMRTEIRRKKCFKSFTRAGSLAAKGVGVKLWVIRSWYLRLKMRVIGIDEAGYGPMLGHLVVGAVSIECEQYQPEAIWACLGEGWAIADSKTVLAHGNMASGEETTLSLLTLLGLDGSTVQGVLERLLVPPPELVTGDRSPDVPPDAPLVGGAFCDVDVQDGRPVCCTALDAALPRWGGEPTAERIADLRRRLASVGVTLEAARAVAICPGLLNRAVGSGVSKLLVDWRLFAELIQRDAEALRPEGLVACGKLGGRAKYGGLLMDLGLSAVIVEGRALSAYQVAGLGRVEFVRHAEAFHPPVAMASMIAKLVREYLLDGWHSMLAAEIEELEPCSGYHNRVTERYVERTAEARARLGILNKCFIRSK
jgi:ribonuclease HII